MARKFWKWFLLAWSVALLFWPPAARAQFIGYVSGQTVQQRVFTNQAANGASPTLTNLGNASHFLTYCNTAFIGTITFQASPDGTFSPPITLATASYGNTLDTACHILQAGGYYPTFRAVVSNYNTGSVNAWYSASGMPIAFAPAAFGSNGPTSPVACDRSDNASFASGSPPGAFIGVIAGNSTAKIYLCQLTISFDTNTNNGEIDISESTDATCTASNGQVIWRLFTTPQTPQTLTFGGPLGFFLTGRFPVGPPARCFMLQSTAGAGTHIDYSWAQF